VNPEDLPLYCSSRQGGQNDRAHMLFAFPTNPVLWLALARRQAEPIITAVASSPRLAAMAQWATFLRNHDELDLSGLTSEQRADAFAEFAPEARMRLYDRGIRRRLAPMLRRDQAWMRLAYSLQFTMPGTPVLRYGEEIGMGENLNLPGLDAIRTPMQWEPGSAAGFSTGVPERFCRPLAGRGSGGCLGRTSATSCVTRTRSCAGSTSSSVPCASAQRLGSAPMILVPLHRARFAGLRSWGRRRREKRRVAGRPGERVGTEGVQLLHLPHAP
jgi:hypothetical protein